MTVHSGNRSRASQEPSQEQWLKLYYFVRTAFSAVWVAAAFTVGQHSWVVAAVFCGVMLSSAAAIPPRARPAISVSFVVEPAAVEAPPIPSTAPTDAAESSPTE